MRKLSQLLAACALLAFASVHGYYSSPRALLSYKDSFRTLDTKFSRTLLMNAESSGENPLSMKQSFLSNSRDLLISFSVVAITTASTNIRRADAVTSGAAVADAVSTSTASTTTTAATPAQSTALPVITNKVYLDIKIANYTEESTGTNKGADGSGRVVFGLYGKDAPESVARVSDNSIMIVIKDDFMDGSSYDYFCDLFVMFYVLIYYVLCINHNCYY